ncbi:FG-GAP repeat domain-containing protein [candidate division KSB1 bacterium]
MGAYPQIADWNGDDKKDLLVGDTGGNITLFLNTGTNSEPVLTDAGYIQAGGIYLSVGARAAPVVVDWNNDNRKDLVVGSDAGYIYLFLNTGTDAAPVFDSYEYITGGGGIAIEHFRSSPEVYDMDDDGRKDLIVGGWDGYAYLYFNVGTDSAPEFFESVKIEAGDTDLHVNNSAKFDLADWDNNGDVDIIIGEWNAYVSVFTRK